MTQFRKYARFQLTVAVVAAVAVLTILAFTQNVMASLAGFAVLALLGVQGMRHSRDRPSPVEDERDEAILNRANSTGYAALWILLVAWGVAIPLMFMDGGLVPVAFVAPVVWVGWWLMVTVRSVAVLVLDRRGF